GYTLYDEEHLIGEIIEVIEQPHQILCAILYKGKEALIPMHEENLLKIDKKKKQVIVQLPEGLLDIYTSA
ncbi:MAG: 16S rRNA processing protein RimM, partial [Ferruginibacter sp.]|nr:16S rRNA processing protein RimM [Ferruginibacter sp.]